MEFARHISRSWPAMLATFGEAVIYTDATDTTHDLQAVVSERGDTQIMDATWETAARQAEIHIAADDMSAITFTPRQDKILARGTTYTVLERDEHSGAITRLLCERAIIDAVAMRGRRYS